MPLGFVTAAAYIWMARPTRFTIVIGSVIAGIGLFVRALASGRVQKNEVLTVSGPYAYTRNPLYFGSLVMAAGFVLAARSWVIAAIVIAMFLLIYLPVIRGEEEFLRNRFPDFAEYERNVPRLIPRLIPYQSSSNSFYWHLYWKHREYKALLGTVLMIAALIIKASQSGR